MAVDNCKRCGNLFQKTLVPLCKPCYDLEQDLHQNIKQHIQSNPGVMMDVLAETFKMPLKEMETLLCSTALGNSVKALVRVYCSRCKCEMNLIDRNGYFCQSCQKQIEKETEACRQVKEEPKGIYSSYYASVRGGQPAEASMVQDEEEDEPLREFKNSVNNKNTPNNNNNNNDAASKKPHVAKYGFKRISS